MAKLDSFRYRKYEVGFSLIELMVAMALGIVLAMGVTTVVVNSSRSYGDLAKASQLIENGRYAVNLVANDIRHAGFYGEFYRLPNPPTGSTVLPDPCATTVANIQAALAWPIQGYDFDIDSTAATPSPLSACISYRQPGTDVLVIRRTATVTVPENANAQLLPTTLDANRIYLQNTALGALLSIGSSAATNFCQGSTPLSDSKKVACRVTQSTPPTRIPGLIRPFEVHIYFVRSWSATRGDGIPTLCRTELTAGPSMTTVPLVEGVENFQIEYAMDNIGRDNIIDPATLAGTDFYVTRPNNVTDWPNVMAVRFYILVRSLSPSTGYSDNNKVYDLGIDGTVTRADSFKRHVFSTVVRLNNLSIRRENPS